MCRTGAKPGCAPDMRTACPRRMRRLLRVNISSPGPLAAWPEVISQHRSDTMMSVLALKVSDYPTLNPAGVAWPRDDVCASAQGERLPYPKPCWSGLASWCPCWRSRCAAAQPERGRQSQAASGASRRPAVTAGRLHAYAGSAPTCHISAWPDSANAPPVACRERWPGPPASSRWSVGRVRPCSDVTGRSRAGRKLPGASRRPGRVQGGPATAAPPLAVRRAIKSGLRRRPDVRPAVIRLATARRA